MCDCLEQSQKRLFFPSVPLGLLAAHRGHFPQVVVLNEPLLAGLRLLEARHQGVQLVAGRVGKLFEFGHGVMRLVALLWRCLQRIVVIVSLLFSLSLSLYI